MTSIQKLEAAKNLNERIISECWRNNLFKSSLVSNPEYTLEKFFGNEFKLPNEFSLIVDDQSNLNHVYLNIPVKPDLDQFELSDEQLEMVSGGEFVCLGIATAWYVGGAIIAGIGLGIAAVMKK